MEPLSPALKTLSQRWSEFSRSSERLSFYDGPEPELSAVIVSYGRVELTLECLRRLAPVDHRIELVLVDNASPDGTPVLLDRIDGARIIRNQKNEGFLLGSNMGATVARAPALLFLNTDAFLHPGSLEAALAKLKEPVGVVGGRLVYASGKLQEAGARVFDGASNTYPYGRGRPFDSQDAGVDRSVDYCSGCFFLTHTKLFRELGGFDTRYAPGYYEDADYCMRARRKGYDVLYASDALVTHLEGASAPKSERVQLMMRNKLRFQDAHRDWKSVDLHGLRVLVVDDRLPTDVDGSGYPRTIELIRSCAELGCKVTLYGVQGMAIEPAKAGLSSDQVTFVAAATAGSLRAYLDRHQFDLIWVSRPHNMKLALPLVFGQRVVYDAESLFAMRGILRAKLFGPDDKQLEELERELKEELTLGAGVAPVVSCVTEPEAQRFREHGRRAYVVSHTTEGELRPLAERRGAVWLGGIHPGVPNDDALRWYLDNVRPLLKGPDELVVIGKNGPYYLKPPPEGAELAGEVSAARLRTLLSSARCMVVPTRWAAGIPLKAVTGMAHGLPIVASKLVAGQLALPAGALASDDPAEFASLVDRILSDDGLWEQQHQMVMEAVQARFSRSAFRRSVEVVLTSALGMPIAGGASNGVPIRRHAANPARPSHKPRSAVAADQRRRVRPQPIPGSPVVVKRPGIQAPQRSRSRTVRLPRIRVR